MSKLWRQRINLGSLSTPSIARAQPRRLHQMQHDGGIEYHAGRQHKEVPDRVMKRQAIKQKEANADGV